ncbi:MAG: methyltransferase domain-containing protein [Thermoplasmata archaeon]
MTDKNFDSWAKDYDKTVSQRDNGYPFKGYYRMLRNVRDHICDPKGKDILDIGVGTGLLSRELYDKGANITGNDISQKSIKRAKEKMPRAEFYL